MLSGQGNLLGQQTNQLGTMLQFMNAQANARNAQASVAADLAGMAGNKEFGMGSLFGDIGGAILGESNPFEGFGNWLNDLF